MAHFARGGNAVPPTVELLLGDVIDVTSRFQGLPCIVNAVIILRLT